MRCTSRAIVSTDHVNVPRIISVMPILADYGHGGLAFLFSLPVAVVISLGLCGGGVVVLRSANAKERKGLGWKLVGCGLACLVVIPYSVLLVARFVSH